MKRKNPNLSLVPDLYNHGLRQGACALLMGSALIGAVAQAGEPALPPTLSARLPAILPDRDMQIPAPGVLSPALNQDQVPALAPDSNSLQISLEPGMVQGIELPPTTTRQILPPLLTATHREVTNILDVGNEGLGRLQKEMLRQGPACSVESGTRGLLFDFGPITAGRPSESFRRQLEFTLFCERETAYRVELRGLDGSMVQDVGLEVPTVTGDRAFVRLTVDGAAFGSTFIAQAPGRYTVRVLAEPRQSRDTPLTPDSQPDWHHINGQYVLSVESR